MDEKKPSEIGEELLSAKKKNNKVKPGPCSPRGCPPPTEIVCIKTKKVYQECKRVEPIERVKVHNIYVPPGATDVECVRVRPGVISCHDAPVVNSALPPLTPQSTPGKPVGNEILGGKKKKRECECEVGDGTVTLGEIKHFPIQITLEFFDRNGMSLGVQTGWAKICIPERTVCLSRAGESQLKCEVDIFLKCLMCFLEDLEPNTVLSAADERSAFARHVTCCINKIIVFKLFAEVQLMVPSYGFCPEPPECEEEVLGECPDAVEEWPPYPDDNGNGGCKSCR